MQLVGGRAPQMQAWLLTFSCLLSVTLTSAVPEPDTDPPLGADALWVALSKLGFADLCQASYASKGFRVLADEAIKALYRIRHNEQAYLNYTPIIRELNALLEDAKLAYSGEGGNVACKYPPHIACILSILEPRFGCCIQHSKSKAASFHIDTVSLHILHDPHKLSALPYILDQEADYTDWIYLIRGLVELGRFDLLGQMTFSGIKASAFRRLMSVPLPESIRLAAAKSLQHGLPQKHLSLLLAFVESELIGASVLLPRYYKPPLFVLRHFCEKSLLIPHGWTLTDGLKKSAISFWMHVLRSGDERAKEMLCLVLQRADSKSKYLARAFYEPLPPPRLKGEKQDVYQAMLIRFRFSPLCNEHITQSYNLMLEQRLKPGYHTALALLDCQQSSLLDHHLWSLCYPSALEAIANRMYRLKDDRLTVRITEMIQGYRNAATLLKHLIVHKADDVYAQLVWTAIQTKPVHSPGDYCCFAPLRSLKRLVFDQSVSIDRVKNMLGMLHGFWDGKSGELVSKEAHALYTVMFWEASEEVINYFLDQVPGDRKPALGLEHAYNLARLAKHSAAFRETIVGRFEKLSCNGLGMFPRQRGTLFGPVNDGTGTDWHITDSDGMDSDSTDSDSMDSDGTVSSNDDCDEQATFYEQISDLSKTTHNPLDNWIRSFEIDRLPKFRRDMRDLRGAPSTNSGSTVSSHTASSSWSE